MKELFSRQQGMAHQNALSYQHVQGRVYSIVNGTILDLVWAKSTSTILFSTGKGPDQESLGVTYVNGALRYKNTTSLAVH